MEEERIRQIIREELSQLFYSDRYVFHKPIHMLDGRNIHLATTNGTSLGTGSTQKLKINAQIGFFNTTPVSQQGAMSAADAATVDTTYGAEEAGVINNIRTRVGEVETALENLGLIASN